ncbi:ester cyclase [Aliiroseovarius sp. M344]|uniref:nuclear transport factor 2 family protein n=1 Tax=Aliiroseovarius sp. M344 TaxID=2867010 RepID=UPI0021ADFE24|nr:ester cyclase [Aliiroseovarius sp. M344]UWQ15118.1 ester cyclase [Aliiroseovarius sp. M344]
MKGFSNRWKDFPDYIIGITKEIWEERGVGTLNQYYAPDIPVRSPMGISQGNQSVIAATMATINEFPDRELRAEDVIWSDHPEYGLLSSHRLITSATHTRDGQFGPASGKQWTVRVIADCAAKNDTIYDEWLVRDYGGIVRQLGMDPAEYAANLISAEGGPDHANPVFLPENDIAGDYAGRGNDNEWGQRYADLLARIMDHDFNCIYSEYDRAVIGEYAGAKNALGWAQCLEFWVGLRSSFPHAEFRVHHQIGMDADMLSPRAALRWSLDGTHDGWGSFGKPTGKRVHVFGMSHAEFGPWGLRRECALYDEIAIWKQILMQTGAC